MPEFNIDSLVDTWKLNITFDEVIDFISNGELNKQATEIKKVYQETDPHFRKFIDTIIEQTFLVGKLHGGQEIKDIIGAFFEQNGLPNIFKEIDFTKRPSKQEIFNAKRELSKRSII